MDNIVTFRTITPIFHFTMDGDGFSHRGTAGEVSFEITLDRYGSDPAKFQELMRHTTDHQQKKLGELGIPSGRFGSSECYLVVSVVHAAEDIPGYQGNSMESLEINQAMTDALRLHSSKGFDFGGSYQDRFPESTFGGVSTATPFALPWPFPHLGVGASNLTRSEWVACLSTFDNLLSRLHNSHTTFDKVIELSMSYHRISFTLERRDHAFLILWIAFEAMFKRVDEKTPKAANRLSRLLAQNREEQKLISRRFSQSPKCYRWIRDEIAHSSVEVDDSTVAAAYKQLHAYITRAIIRMLNVSGNEINPNYDYYDEIERLIDDRWRTQVVK